MSNDNNLLAKIDAVGARVEVGVQANAALLERAGYSPEAYARVVINAVVMNPNIVMCTEQSMDRAVLTAMNAGLIPDGREAAIVPFGKEATLLPMVEGLQKLARQATPGLSIRAVAVYKGDKWDYAEGLYPKLDHIPSPTASNSPDDIEHVYAVARFPNGGIEYDVMARPTIDRYRAYSKARGGPWNDHYEEMAKKAVIKRLLKRLPRSANDPGPPPQELANIDDGRQLVTVDHDTGAIIDPPAANPTQTPAAARGNTEQAIPHRSRTRARRKTAAAMGSLGQVKAPF